MYGGESAWHGNPLLLHMQDGRPKERCKMNEKKVGKTKDKGRKCIFGSASLEKVLVGLVSCNQRKLLLYCTQAVHTRNLHLGRVVHFLSSKSSKVIAIVKKIYEIHFLIVLRLNNQLAHALELATTFL